MARVFTITEGLENMGALKTGGQGSVYKGRRTGEIISAVKLLPTPIHSEDPNDKNYRDFQNEVHKLKKVNEHPNPNIVKIISSGVTDTGGFPFIEMEFIEGPDLEDLLKSPHDPVFTIKEAIKVAEHLSHALGHCHSLDVKHGDIKSNNIKYNERTGNYILIDFGLSAMSNEQRRSSLRHAGAVEFMAPEQSDGLLHFESDIYSFGVILFELLAGVVPFPLNDRSESARNQVMLAHLETPPPDLRELRLKNIPDSWSDTKKKIEAQIPEWLVSMIYRCLRKKPQERFINGKEVHDYILLNSSLANNNERVWSADQLYLIQQKNEELEEKNIKLQQAVLKYQYDLDNKNAEIQKLREGQNLNLNTPKKKNSAVLIATLIVLLSLSGLIYVLATNSNPDPEEVSITKPTKEKQVVIGQYRVLAAKAFFYTEPHESKRRSAYIFANDPVKAYDEQNGFIYTEFTNSKNQVTKGWLRKKDLITVEEWNLQKTAKQKPLEEVIKEQLIKAEDLQNSFQFREALVIYKELLSSEVPEAMYHYGNMALLSQHSEIDCDMALQYVENASSKGYTPAKSTLGFLYLFAENNAVLSMNDYNKCTITRDVTKALKLLNEAALKGDDAAKQILSDYTKSNPTEQQ